MENLLANHKSVIGKIKQINQFIALNIPFINEFKEYFKLLPLYDEELNVKNLLCLLCFPCIY